MYKVCISAFCPEGAFCVGTLKIFDVRASVRPSVPSRSCNQFEFKLDLVATNLDLNSNWLQELEKNGDFRVDQNYEATVTRF